MYSPTLDGSVVFTVPVLASIGLAAEAAHAKGLQFPSMVTRRRSEGSLRMGETTSRDKGLVEEGSQGILGAHLSGLHAEEVMNIFAVAI